MGKVEFNNDSVEVKDLDIDNISFYYPQLSRLTGTQRMVLLGIVDAAYNGESITDTELARRLKVDPATVRNARANPVFAQAVAFMMKNVALSKTDIVLARLFNKTESSIKAIELFLKYSEAYIPKQRTESISMNINPAVARDASYAIKILVQKLGELGYDRQRIIDEITECYDMLDEEGAF